MSWTARAGLASYRLAGHLVVPLAKRKLKQRAAAGKEDPKRLSERLGYPSAERPSGRLLWVHGASVGESLAGLVLVEALAKEDPTVRFLMTTGTVASANLLAGILPDNVVHQYVPLDLPLAVDRFLNHWRPNAALMLESEFWPNVLHALDRRQIPRALVNGRMSPESFERWTSLRPVIERLLSGFACCLVQSERDARFLNELGARGVKVTGNLKEAAKPLAAAPDQLAALVAMIDGRPRWLAASTHPGEEELVAEAHKKLVGVHPRLLTFIVPRHPERGPAVLDMVERAGLLGKLRSLGEQPGADCEVYIADTIGEMGLWYRLCDIAFVGKSLVGVGGQNPLEPAQLGCAIMFGPNMSNFELFAADLEQAGAARRVADAETLTSVVGAWLDNEDDRATAADAAMSYARAGRDALETTLHALRPMLTGLGTGAKV